MMSRETLLNAVVEALRVQVHPDEFGAMTIIDEDGTRSTQFSSHALFSADKAADHLHATVITPLEARIAELEAKLKLTNKQLQDTRDDLKSTRVAYENAVRSEVVSPTVTLEDALKALRPFAKLGQAISDPRSPDCKAKEGTTCKNAHAIFVGQVIRGATPEDDVHAPVTMADLRRAAFVYGGSL